VAARSPRTQQFATRDMRKVPPLPERVRVRTGDRVRIEVVADHPGHFTVFNVGPTGNLNLLYPHALSPDEIAGAPIMPANRPLHVLDVEMTPPAGCERLCAVWSRVPLLLDLGQLNNLVEKSGARRAASRPYVATRDMKRVQQEIQQLRPGDWHAVVLELDHEP
jgi:hypothetical protein